MFDSNFGRTWIEADTDNIALNFHFHVKAAAPDGNSEVRFLDGAQQNTQPLHNALTSLGRNVTPEVATSFLLVDCLFQIRNNQTSV